MNDLKDLRSFVIARTDKNAKLLKAILNSEPKVLERTKDMLKNHLRNFRRKEEEKNERK